MQIKYRFEYFNIRLDTNRDCRALVGKFVSKKTFLKQLKDTVFRIHEWPPTWRIYNAKSTMPSVIREFQRLCL